MTQTYTFTGADFVNGNISSSGAWISQSNRLRPNDFIDVTDTISVSIRFSGTNGANLEASISCINVNGRLDREFFWLTSPASATLPSNIARVAIIFRRSDNANLTPSDLENLTVELNIKGDWIIQNDELINTDFLSTPDKPFQGDSPYTMWRVDPDVNDSMPYVGVMVGVPAIAPPPMYIQPSRPLIHAYGSREVDFNSNGYAIIEPIRCEIYHEENGVYEATFETFCDKYGKYTYPRKQAQVKIPMRYHGETIYQIFRIRQYRRTMDAAGNYRITATAQAKFYDLSRRLIQDCRPTQLAGNAALEWIFTHGWYGGNDNTEFLYSSDIPQARTAYYQNCTVTAALLGVDQCFVNRWGGRLYRDNNYFSINAEMEGCQKSGIIMYSYNMTEIDFEEDDSELITILEAEDNFGNRLTITNPAVPTDDIPHHIYGYAKFTYETEDLSAFQADAQAYFDEYKQSRVNITVRFANLSDLQKYRQFLQLDDFEVGDKVTIYHKDLDIYYSNLEIISKTFDVVAQKTMEIQIGSFKNAITRRAYMADTVSSGGTTADKQYIALDGQLDEVAFYSIITTPIATADGKLLTTADGKYIQYKA